VDLLCREDQLVLIPGAAEAVRRLNDAGVLVIVATNQPVVARNLCTEEDVRRLNARLEEMLRQAAGARLDAVYFCPHHPETHHPDGNPAYRGPCPCRKPNIGMLEEARKRFGLDYSRCFVVGDSTRDIQTGVNAGCRTILVRTGYGGRDAKFDAAPDEVVDDLAAAVDSVLSGRPAGRPCRILLVGPLPPPLGGCTILFQYLVQALADRSDVEVRVLSTSGPPANAVRRVARGIFVLCRLLRAVRRTDVLTLHTTTTALLVLGGPVVALGWLFHKPVVIRKFGGPSHRLAGRLHGAYGRLRLAVLRWALRRADLYLAETRPAVRAAIEDGIRAERYPNNRPLVPGGPEHPVGGRCRRFVFASHVQPTKGIRELIEAGEHLPPDAWVDVYGPLCGGVTEDDFAGLKRVRYGGALDADAVVAVLAQHDALVLPTYHAGEGHPGILIEGFLAGVPAIATRWQHVPEVVDDTCALLVEPRDPESLRAAMQRLYDDEDLYRRLCEGARHRREEFSTQRWADWFVRQCVALAVREREPH